MAARWFIWWKEYENGLREPQLWQFEYQLITIAPRKRIPYGGHVCCTTCGKWISGYHSSINHHACEHAANGEGMDWVHFFEQSVFSDN
jgi:hypothetical protein